MHFQELERGGKGKEKKKNLPQMALKHKFAAGAVKWRLLKQINM